jgi:multiple sugar transport system substrate-binding protein
MPRIIKLLISAVIFLAAAALLLTPGRASERPPESFTVLRYWEKWTGKEGAQMKQIVDDFNSTVGKEKHIFVQYISMSQVDQKTLVSTAAGDPPEIAGIWDNQLAQFAALDALEPLTNRANARGLTRDYYKHVYYDGCSYEGTLYAFPSTPAAVALHYNKAIIAECAAELRKAGFDPDKIPDNLDDFDRFAAILDKRDPEGRLVRAGYLPQEPGWWITYTPIWFGGDIYDPKTRRLLFDTPAAVEGFRWIASYSRRLGLDEMRRFRAGFPQGFDTPQSPFFAGTVAMVQQGPWTANFISVHNPKMSNTRGLTPDELSKLNREQRRENCSWAACPVPTARGTPKNVTYASMDILVIPRTAKHKDESFEFLAYVQRQDVMEKLNSLHCKNSPLAKSSPSFIANHPNPYIEVFEALAASPNAHPIPPLPVWNEVSSEIGVACEQVYLQQLTPEQAAAKVQKSGQKTIDRFFARQELRKKETQNPKSEGSTNVSMSR